MALNSRHPLYAQYLADWQLCRDSYQGERVIKDKGKAYLPATSGQEADGMTSENSAGYKSYQAYKTRAVFPDYMSLAVETAIGLMWSKPPTIELPKIMEPLLEKATTKGEGLFQLLRRINEQQLVVGRLGLLADMPETPDAANPLPYIALYHAEDIINWDDGRRDEIEVASLNLVVLNESEYERDGEFQWVWKEKHRVLTLGETEANEKTGVYRVGVFREANATFAEAGMIEPKIRGLALQVIPFAFINSKDIVTTPDNPPLIGLGRLCMTIYRGEADYRQSLFMQGQDTLVTIGAGQDEETIRVGAGATVNVPIGGDAKYIGVSSSGLAEQRQALAADRKEAASKAGQLIDNTSKDKESADALRTRLAAQTATLNQIALSGAEGLQSILRIVAVWLGAKPEEVIVTPNLEFTQESMLGDDLVKLMTAKSMGAPLSAETIHENMQRKNLTSLSYEDEIQKIADEAPLLPPEPNNPDDVETPNNKGA